MNLKKYLIMLFALSTTTTFASEYCPQTLTTIHGEFVPPAGWIVTHKQLINTPLVKLSFVEAAHNYDQQHKMGNGNKISCYYLSNTKTSQIEIATERNNIPKPIEEGTRWTSMFGTTTCGIYQLGAKTIDCPWG